MGRIRDAWYVLMGQRITPQEIQSEWVVIQAQAAEMFSKFNTLAARLVKAEKHLLDARMAQMEAQEQSLTLEPGPTPDDRKAALRRRVYGGLNMRGRVSNVVNDESQPGAV